MTNDKTVNINVLREKKRRIIRRNRTIAVILLLAVIFIVLVLTDAFDKLMTVTGLKADKYVEARGVIIDYKPKGKFICTSINNTIIVIDENGITGLNYEGKWKWNIFYELLNPQVITYNSMVLITDTGGTSIFSFNESGLLWQMQFDQGVIASYYSDSTKHLSVIHKEDKYKTCITVYDTKDDNKPLFTRKFGAYYMMNADISSDASQLCVSGVYSEAGVSTAVISFLRMRDGEVYSTEIFDDKIYPYIKYIDKNILFAANSDEMIKIVRDTTASDAYDSEKVIWERNAQSTALLCIEQYKDKYILAAFSEGNNELVSNTTVSTIRIYKSNGKIEKEFLTDGKIKGIEEGKDTFSIYTDNSVSMYNLSGKCISRYNAVSDIKSISYIGKRTILVSGAQKLAIVYMDEKNK